MIRTRISFTGKLQDRLKKLPVIMESLARAKLKRDAAELIKIFQDGLRRNSLGLKQLSRDYVAVKRRRGFSKPANPLVAGGDQKKNSYINMLRIRKVKQGYTVRPSWARHWESDLKLRDLFLVHEYGTVIAHGKGESARLVRIPPRPAFLKSYQIFIRRQTRGQHSKTIQNAVTRYLQDGKDIHEKQGVANIEKGIQRFVERLMEDGE